MEAIQTIERAESMRVEAAILQAMPRIVIHVAGGGVQIVSKPAGVVVEVHDFDTFSETGESIERFAAEDEIRERL